MRRTGKQLPGSRALWDQLIDALMILIGEGLAHGDLSPFNLLVHRGRLVLIDLPQVVDIVANPQGPAFLAWDIRIVTDWFIAHGLPTELADTGAARVLAGTQMGSGSAEAIQTPNVAGRPH